MLVCSLFLNQSGYAAKCVNQYTQDTVDCVPGDPNLVPIENTGGGAGSKKAPESQSSPGTQGLVDDNTTPATGQQSGKQGVTEERTDLTNKPRQGGEKKFGENVDVLRAAEKFKKKGGITSGSGSAAGLVPELPPITFQSETGKPLASSSSVKYLGTSLFLNCQRQTSKAWSDMVNTYKQKTTSDMWGDSWWTLAKSIEQKFEDYRLTPEQVEALNKSGESADYSGFGGGSDTTSFGDASSFGSDDQQQGDQKENLNTGNHFEDAKKKLLAVKAFVRKGIARGKGKSLILKKCTALVPSTSFVNYNSSEDTVAIVPKASIDRKLACRSRGAETQDYPECRKLVKWWDGFFIGKKLMETGQKIKYQMDAKQRQEDLALDMASKNPDPLLPLKMQKAGVDDQAAVAFQNSFFLGAQFAVMKMKFDQWPDREEVVKTCQKAVTSEKEDPNLETYLDWFKSLITAFEPYAKKIHINNLLDEFKKKDDIVASCEVSPTMGMGSMMGGSYGGGSYGSSFGSSFGSFGGSSFSDYNGMSSSSSGEGEGAIGAVQYQNCDQILMQNAQMDAQSAPQMPQGMMSPMGGAMGMMGGSSYGDQSYGGGSYGSGGYDSYGGGMGGMGAMGGMGGMPGGEMIMGAMLGQSQDACIDVMNSGTQLILNFQSRESLKMVMVQTGIEAISNLMKGMMLRKQSAKIQSLIDGMPVPDPALDKISQQEEDLVASVCQIAPQEPICADFSNRSNGFNSPNIDLSPPEAASTLARVKGEEQGMNAIEKEMEQIAATELGQAGTFPEASSGAGGAAAKAPSVTFKAAEGKGGGGDISTDAKMSEAAAAADKGAEGEEAAAPETAYAGGTEAREYKGPGFRADQYKSGQEGGLDKIAGEYGSMGFRDPASEGISPKEAGGLFKIISDRYEMISKGNRLMEVKTDVAK